MSISGRLNRLLLLVRCLARVVLHGRANKVPVNVSRIIVVPTGKLGDVVCCTPVLRAVRAYLPATKIIVAGNSKLHQPVLSESGLVDEYLDLVAEGVLERVKECRANVAIVTGPSYDATSLLCAAGISLVVAPVVVGGFSPSVTKPYKILQRLVKTYDYHIGEYAPRERLKALESLGIFTDDTKKQLGFSTSADQKAKQFFADNNIDLEKDFVVAVSPSAGNKIKEWPVERFAQVADYLVEKYNAKVIIVGSKADDVKAKGMLGYLNKKEIIINAVGQFNIDELKAFISKIKMFISVDTGPIYIAEAFNIPTIDITGPIDEKEQPPSGILHRNVVPPVRSRPELFVLNAKSYNRKEALRQVLSITFSLVASEIDKLVCDNGL